MVPSAREASDVASEPEFDRVDDAALAGSIRTRNREVLLSKVDIEFPDASHFLDVGRFELYHLSSPPAGSEKIFTRSSAFSFLVSASKVRSWSIFSASTSLDSASFRKELVGYLLLKRRHVNFQSLPVNCKAASLLCSPLSLAYAECVNISHPPGPPASGVGVGAPPGSSTIASFVSWYTGIVAFYGYVGDSAALNSGNR